VLVEGCERVVAPCAELLADERMAALYLGRHAGARPATATTAADRTGQPAATAGQEPV
jgi:branched-chain amino acid transport system ATP-binding protein